MAWSTRSKLFFLHSNSVAQNSLISEFRAFYGRTFFFFINPDFMPFLKRLRV